jgi:hypothetical protein
LLDAKSLFAYQHECCNAKHVSNPIETLVMNRFIVEVFIVDGKLTLITTWKEKNPIFNATKALLKRHQI